MEGYSGYLETVYLAWPRVIVSRATSRSGTKVPHNASALLKRFGSVTTHESSCCRPPLWYRNGVVPEELCERVRRRKFPRENTALRLYACTA